MGTLLTLAKGDTGPLTVTVSHTTMGATGLTPYLTANGGRLWFYGKYDVSDPDALTNGTTSGAVFTKTEASGAIVVTTAGNNTTTDGVVTITLQPADTTIIPVDTPITLYCSLKGATADSPNLEYTIVKDVLLNIGAQATSKVS